LLIFGICPEIGFVISAAACCTLLLPMLLPAPPPPVDRNSILYLINLLLRSTVTAYYASANYSFY